MAEIFNLDGTKVVDDVAAVLESTYKGEKVDKFFLLILDNEDVGKMFKFGMKDEELNFHMDIIKNLLIQNKVEVQ